MFSSKKIRSSILLGVFIIAGSVVFSAFAQLPPPPPPPPPGGTGPAPTPGGPAGASSDSWSCPDSSSNTCCNVSSGTDAQQRCDSACNSACNLAGIVCWVGASCPASSGGSILSWSCTDSSKNTCCNTMASGIQISDAQQRCDAACGASCQSAPIVCWSGASCPAGISNGGPVTCTTPGAPCPGTTDCTCKADNTCNPPGDICTNVIDVGGGVGNTGGNDPNDPPQTNNPFDKTTPEKDYGTFGKDPGKGNLDLSILKPGNFTDFLALLSCVFKYLLYFAIPIAVIVFAIGGIMFLTSQGDPGKITTGKSILLWGVVGLIIVLLARGILAAILGFFTGGASVAFSSCSVF